MVTQWSVLLSTRKEATDTHNNADESNKHNNEQEKVDMTTVLCRFHLCEMKDQIRENSSVATREQWLRLWGMCVHWEGALLECRGSSIFLSEGLTQMSQVCAL